MRTPLLLTAAVLLAARPAHAQQASTTLVAAVPSVLSVAAELQPSAAARGAEQARLQLRVSANSPWKLVVRAGDPGAGTVRWRARADDPFRELGSGAAVAASGAPGRDVPVTIDYRWSAARPVSAGEVLRYTLLER